MERRGWDAAGLGAEFVAAQLPVQHQTVKVVNIAGLQAMGVGRCLT